jgi:hypothetical protein
VIESKDQEIAVLKRPARATASMLFSDKFADVVFVCGGGERIPAHRFIVAACSESLDALLSNPQWLETADDRERVAAPARLAERDAERVRDARDCEGDNVRDTPAATDLDILDAEREADAVLDARDRDADRERVRLADRVALVDAEGEFDTVTGVSSRIL